MYSPDIQRIREQSPKQQEEFDGKFHEFQVNAFTRDIKEEETLGEDEFCFI